MKSEILKALRQSTQPVSGNALSAALGTSRVAVWKHIQKLQELGYGIETGPKGYRLGLDPDGLFPWEFPGREAFMVYVAEAPSTMDIAKEMARKGCPAFTTVIAGRQTQGRGRLRRSWHSAEGGLYLTVVLRPQIPVLLSPRVNFLAALTLARILRSAYGVQAGLKWPNDILVGGRKLSGLLSEMETEGEQVSFLNIGLGINVNNSPGEVEPQAVSLKDVLGKNVPRRDLLARFLDELQAGLHLEAWDAIIPEWKRYTVTLNRPVRIVTAREETEGIAVDVDENGALILKLPDRSTRAVIYGDCFLQAR
jgi:BirA family biotin operon repressor/biotin-[acetyl-CoA-carboxylase] ligase